MNHVQLKMNLSRNQAGAAITEMLVLMTAMIPLAFAIPMMGKMLDLRHTTIMASRYVAWEEAKGPAAIAASRTPDVVGSRFYLDPDSAIRTAAGGNGQQGNGGGTNRLWGAAAAQRSQSSNNAGLWSGFNFNDGVTHVPDAMYSGAGKHALGGGTGLVADSVESAGQLLNFASGVNWDVEGGDYSRGEVRVEAQVGNLINMAGGGCQSAAAGAPASGSGGQTAGSGTVCFQEQNAIFADSWSASSSRQVKERTKAFVPASVLDPVGRFLSHFGRLKVVEELEGLENAFGHVDVSVLPPGRSLGTYRE